MLAALPAAPGLLSAGMAEIDQLRACVEAATGHAVRDDALLLRACTHSSRLGAQADLARRLAEANERLEFLGDALLGAALAEWLHERLPEADEGELSRQRGRLASRRELAQAWDRAGLAAAARIGAQMAASGPLPDSVKANLVEAILAAIYLDAGWTALTAAVRRLLAPAAERPDLGEADPRMRLQQWCLARHRRLPEGTWSRTGGTDHAPEFTATLAIDGRSASGSGSSRKAAEAAAASALLVLLEAARSG